jgi:hypothetical protein
MIVIDNARDFFICHRFQPASRMTNARPVSGGQLGDRDAIPFAQDRHAVVAARMAGPIRHRDWSIVNHPIWHVGRWWNALLTDRVIIAPHKPDVKNLL